MSKETIQQLVERHIIDNNGQWNHENDEAWIIAGQGQFKITREEFNSAADRMRGKPDWSTLPAKAEWLAQDRCGIWKPMQGRRPTIEGGSYWVTDHHLQPQLRGTVIGDWRNTLEKRPDLVGVGVAIGGIDDIKEESDPLNGYLWGVECHTCGKKPNLPDDVFVQPLINGINWLQCSHKVSDIDWTVADSFKITDVRYKPSEPEQAEPAPAKPWFEAGELPPVGEAVMVNIFHQGTHEATVIGAFQRWVWLDVKNKGIDTFDVSYISPAKTDKEKAIEAAIKVCTGVNIATTTDSLTMKTLNKLYDAGLLRLPDNKKPD